MKQLILWAGIALGISACSNVETGNLFITGEYRAVVDGVNQDIICDNKSSFVTYSFDYTGDLASWTSSLEGVKFGQVKNTQDYTIVGTPPVNGNVTDTYDIVSGAAPLSKDGGLSAQGIVVVPFANVIGRTRVLITAFDSRGFATFTKRSNSLPVADNC